MLSLTPYPPHPTPPPTPQNNCNRSKPHYHFIQKNKKLIPLKFHCITTKNPYSCSQTRLNKDHSRLLSTLQSNNPFQSIQNMLLTYNSSTGFCRIKSSIFPLQKKIKTKTGRAHFTTNKTSPLNVANEYKKSNNYNKSCNARTQ